MSWNILKKAITDVIKTNGNEEITGQNLQNTLVSMVNALGDNSTFAGFALPTTNPGNPDGPVFYLANVAGVYSNFSGYEVKEGEAVVLNWDGSGNWSKHTLTTGAGGSNGVKDLGGIGDDAFTYLANLDNLVTKTGDGAYIFDKPILYSWYSGRSANLAISLASPSVITQFHFGYAGSVKVRYVQWSVLQGVVQQVTAWNDYAVTSGRAGFMTPNMFKILEGASGVMGGNAQVIEWSHTHNMNDYKDAGTYRIKGERTGNPLDDNLPIMNSGSGHTIEGILYVLDSSLTNGSGNNDDCTITQFLMLSNRVGGQEGDMYMRSAYGANKDSLAWKSWEKYQTNMEVGVVGDDATHDATTLAPINSNGLKTFVDNGIYSGVYLTQEALEGDKEKAETFVMVVINNYVTADANKTITQIKFAVATNGTYSQEYRTLGSDGSWSDWHNEMANIKDAIAQINTDMEQMGDNIMRHGEEIEDLQEGVFGSYWNDWGWIEGAYVGADGNLATSVDLRYSKPVKVKAGDVIYLSGAGTGISAISTTQDPTGETFPYTVKIKMVDSSPTDYAWSVEEDSYVVISGRCNRDVGNVEAYIERTSKDMFGIVGHQFTDGGSFVNHKVSANTLYKLDVLRFDSREVRSNYSKIEIKINNSSASSSRLFARFYGNQNFPRSIYFKTEEGEDSITVLVRVKKNYRALFRLSVSDKQGVFEWNNQTKSLIALNNMQKTGGQPNLAPFVLLHFSDIHADKENLERIIAYRYEFNTKIDDMIHTGDSVGNKVNSSSFDFWTSTKDAPSILNVLGNHDNWYESGFTPASNHEYLTYFKPFVTNWGAVVPSNAEENNLCYYYKDYSDKKIRLIVLDYSNITSAQNEWFASALNDAKSKDYAVIVAIHYTPTISINFDTGFNFGTDRFSPEGGFQQHFLNTIDTFKGNGGEFVCWICGHQHTDLCGAYKGENGNQVVISIDCAAMRNDSTIRYRNLYDKSRDAFNVMGVNRNTKTISVLRIGRDTDALLRNASQMTIDYGKGELLQTL